MTASLGVRLEYLQRVWAMRYFWFALVQNDLSNRYKRSFLGIGWSLLKPLSMTAVYCIVFAKLFNVPVVDYVPYLLLGMTTWQFLHECLLQGAYSFSLGSAYIKQAPIPLAIFPLRCVLGAGFHALVALSVGLTVTLLFTGYLHILALLYLIPALMLMLILGWSLAIISGVMYTHFPDTRHLLEVGLQILFYMTPILYRPEHMQGRSRMILLLEWNPVTSLLELIRTPVLAGTVPANQHILISFIFIATVTLIGVLLLKKLEKNLIFWI